MRKAVWLHCNSIKFAAAFKTALDIAATRFGEAVRVEHRFNGISVVTLSDPATGQEVAEAAFGVAPGHVEWTHAEDRVLPLWFQYVLASRAAVIAQGIADQRVTMLEETWTGDGRAGMPIEPRYHITYPTVTDWLRDTWDTLNLGAEPPRLEQIYPLMSEELRDLITRPGNERLIPSGSAV